MVAATHQYRVGLIGTGRIAGSIQDEVKRGPYNFLLPYSHAGAYAAVPSTQIVAAADPNRDRLTEFADRWQIPTTYADYREMLQTEQIDIVSICTPTRTHYEVGLDVAARDVKGVLMEKPITQNLREADKLITIFDQRSIPVVVNHIRTFDPFYRRVRELIREGQIGQLHTVMAHWREGMLFGGTHLFDTLRFLTGAEAEWVFGHLDSGDGVFDPGGSGMIRFADGVDVLVNNRAGHAAPSELDIVGTAGRIRIGNTGHPELYTVDSATPHRELVRRVFPACVEARSAMVVAVQELIGAIEHGTRPASTLADARADLELAIAFHLSHQEGRPVRLPVADVDYTIEDPWGRS